MNCEFEDIAELTIMGLRKHYRDETAFSLIPKDWDEYYKKGLNKIVPGYLGVCVDGSDGEFDYYFASFCQPDAEVVSGFEKRTFKPHTWAKFRSVGKMPDAIQKTNRYVFTDWLPNNGKYRMAECVNIEMYTEGDMSSDSYVSELWIPVERI